jgi:exopolyphosphatase/guanosine-5'-triphosphate,3'-diphosphate pyrophosphatase
MPRRAIIDVGTNSVKILLAETDGHAVVPVWETSEQTRLGRGFYETHRLQETAIQATAQAVARFALIARQRGAESVRVVATSAARDALNRHELLDAIRVSSGLITEVLSGETEADWAFAGVASTPGWSTDRILVLDVGGGSTEFILGTGGQPEFRTSLALGSVRWLEKIQPGDAPTAADLSRCRHQLLEFLLRELSSTLGEVLSHRGIPNRTVGVGGSTALLALIHRGQREFDRELIEATTFHSDELSVLVERLWSLPIEQRRQLPGLPPERADVILIGAAIYEAILRAFRLPFLGVSLRGLRFAALMDAPGGTA